jgi:hypothetical protein
VQGFYDSEIAWFKCSEAIRNNDARASSDHKDYLEKTQRKKAAALASNGEEFYHKLFEFSGDAWKYKYANLKPWDVDHDLREYEYDGAINTLHKKCMAGLAHYLLLLLYVVKASKADNLIVPTNVFLV